MPWLPVLGLLGTIIGLTRALPQLVRLQRVKNAAGVSVDGAATSAVVSASWTTYGVLTDQPAVVLASGTPAIIFVLITMAALRYGRTVREFKTSPLLLIAFTTIVLTTGATGLGVALSVGALVANTPHLITAYREKNLSGVSPFTWQLTSADGAIWMAYGLITGDLAILINNIFQFTTSAAIVVRRWSWSRSVDKNDLVAVAGELATTR